MNRPDFDKLSDKEIRQFRAVINESLGQRLAASKRRKKVMEARQKMELKQERTEL